MMCNDHPNKLFRALLLVLDVSNLRRRNTVENENMGFKVYQ